MNLVATAERPVDLPLDTFAGHDAAIMSLASEAVNAAELTALLYAFNSSRPLQRR